MKTNPLHNKRKQSMSQYQFINGNGDAAHASDLSAAGKAGWRVIHMEFNPDGTGANQRLMVLLEKPA